MFRDPRYCPAIAYLISDSTAHFTEQTSSLLNYFYSLFKSHTTQFVKVASSHPTVVTVIIVAAGDSNLTAATHLHIPTKKISKRTSLARKIEVVEVFSLRRPKEGGV